ncbi:replication initiation protein [Butyrivibrio sp. AC2005]|uniref:replication initiation protein n=1 Tax=Butyrivibrio sp. AC2005 TaxID=1280672 RepID=UPI0018CABE10|nr:replication initiation protein [Butyrivibrio sp. AC2005]
MKNKNRPLIDSLGQIEHQTTLTTEGGIIDQDELKPEIVDANGLSVVSEDEERLKEYIKEAISVSSFVETFKDNAHDTLIKLLALQDNKNPLKKGGAGIAYRTDVLLMHCKMEFSTEENIVFDSILGMISTFPENNSYRLEPASFQRFVKYSDNSYIYKIFKKGTEKLKKRHLEFEFDGDDEVTVPWFDVLHYHGAKSKGTDVAYIEFVPTDFFKDLALCSGIVHGAYGKLEVTTQLQGKYTIALYWFLESKKRFREYPGAPEGVFTISIDDFKYQFSIPKSYQTNDIKRRALEPAKQSINAIQECDFTFDYTERKNHGVTVGYQFVIKNKQSIGSSAGEVKKLEDKTDDPLFSKVKIFLESSDIQFTDEQIVSVCDQAKRCGKDAKDMMQIIVAFRKRLDDMTHEPVEEPLKYLCKMIGLQDQSEQVKRNKFNSFTQNSYNYEDLEKQLLDN